MTMDYCNCASTRELEFCTNRFVQQRRLKRARAYAQSRQSLSCSHTLVLMLMKARTKIQTSRQDVFLLEVLRICDKYQT